MFHPRTQDWEAHFLLEWRGDRTTHRREAGDGVVRAQFLESDAWPDDSGWLWLLTAMRNKYD